MNETLIKEILEIKDFIRIVIGSIFLLLLLQAVSNFITFFRIINKQILEIKEFIRRVIGSIFLLVLQAVRNFITFF
jgi:uncharacterized membrane protein YeaQ/YmgE (transglycosylase-associated protein family)